MSCIQTCMIINGDAKGRLSYTITLRAYGNCDCGFLGYIVLFYICEFVCVLYIMFMTCLQPSVFKWLF